ncbi:MAG: universal stress protein [Gammaproteobacteria bacterium]
MKEGPVARTIVARAKHHGADMIVIGSLGFGNIEAAWGWMFAPGQNLS